MKYIKSADDGTNFHHLSVKDLAEARDLFHVHLMNKRNVIATAIGRYRIRTSDFVKVKGKDTLLYKPVKTFPNKPRLLEESIVTEFSWPCVLVFVKKWEDEKSLINDGGNNIIPKSIFMPDGRVIPICVVVAPQSNVSDVEVPVASLKFPVNIVSGGFPLIVYSQGERRIASFVCLVTDANKTYAITNKHVVGKEGTEIYTLFNGIETRIGVSSAKQLGKGKFEEMYPGFLGSNLVINHDTGLVEVDDLSVWKTEVLGFGQIEELKDLNTHTLSLDLINKKVFAFGAVSKELKGEIVGLFYRYKSVGGIEYISDYLISGVDGNSLNTHHGDSGTLWLIEDEDDYKNKLLRPFALQWGQHEFIDGRRKMKRTYALATSLSNICRELDIDLVRGWNIDQTSTWGKFGHFKVGARACDLVSNTKLSKLLLANQENLGYLDESLRDPDSLVKGGSREFTPLSDVADLVWRGMAGNAGVARKNDENNHFADMDDSHPDVMDGKTLLELCFHANGTINQSFIDKDKWLQFYGELDEAKPAFHHGVESPRLGGLPFRVWQMYDIMLKALSNGKVDEFICAGGTMAHYVGDACQALHISCKHDGIKESDKGVHKNYENLMLNNKRNMELLFDGINASTKKVKVSDQFSSGKGAASCVLKLMKKTFDNLEPDIIIKAYRKTKGDNEAFFDEVGKETIENIINGCLTMAIIWQSAWVEGGGDQIAAGKIKKISEDRLIELYEDKAFVPSFNLDKLILQPH